MQALPLRYVNEIIGILNEFPCIRACLQQASPSTLHQLCDDGSDSILIRNNEATLQWGCNPFSSDFIVFNENRIATIIAELLPH